MTSFTITTQYDTDDETINFGTRAICEAGGFIYESTTLASLQLNGEIVAKPQVVANIEHSKPCLMIRNSIAVFEDENFATIVKKYDFDSDISSYCLSSCGHFLFVTLIDGNCHCTHILTGGRIQCMGKIKPANGNKIIKSFIDEKSTSIYFVSTDTTIYKLFQFEEDKLHQSLIERDEKKIEFLISEIQTEKIYSGFNNRNVSYVAAGVFCDKIGIAMISKTKTYLWLNEDKTKLAILPYKLKKVQFFEECNYLMGLREDNLLHVICCQTNVLVKIFDDPVDDFMIMQDQANGPLQICTLTKSQADMEKLELKLMSYLDREMTFKLAVSKTTYLVETINCFMNDFIYLEGTSTTDHIDKILIKSLSEGNLNHRLERLIRRGKYDEAMEFATKFGLNKSLIYKAKASLLVSRINPWVDNSNVDEDVTELICMLDMIDDVHFVVECCSNILLMNYKKMRNVLLYAKNRIKQKIQKSTVTENEDDISLLFMIEDMLKQWDIFKLLKCTDETNSNNIVDEWLKFSKANMFDECIKYLQEGQIEKACIIWSRNFATITNSLTSEKVKKILSWVGQAATPIQLEMWFNHFVPTILSLVSDTLPDVLSWIYEKVFAMELSGIQPWPQREIEFINNFMNILKANQFRFADHFNNLSSQKTSVQQLVQLTQALKEIQQIRDDYCLAVPLEIYTSSPLNVVHLLLKNMKMNNIASFVDGFLRQYITDHSLNFDDVLFSYVEKEINASQDWWVWEEAPWERRLAIIITFFNDLEKRLRSILLMLRKAPVPLTSTMESVIETSYKYSHNLVTDIRKEKSLIPKKTLYKKYGYQQVGLCEELIRYIIKKDSDEAINDICKLTENNVELQGSAVRRYFIVHIENGEIEKAFSILNHFNDEVCQDACNWMIIFTENSIPQKYLNIENWIRALKFAKTALDKIESKTKNNSRFQDERETLIRNIKTMYQLQKEFDINILSSSDLQNNRMEEIVRDYVKKISEGLARNEIAISTACKTLLKLTDLLALSPVFAFNLFYNESKSSEILTFFLENEKTFDWASELKPGDVSLYNKLFCDAITNTDNDNKVIPIIKSVSSQIIDSCTDGDLNEAMLLLPWLNNYPIENEDSYHNDEQGKNVRSGTNNTLQTWQLVPTYTDAAMSSKGFQRFSKKALEVCLYYSDDCEWQNRDLKKEETENWLQKLPTEVEHLTAEYHDISLMHVLQCLQHKTAISKSIPNSLCSLQSLMTPNMRTLVEKVVRTLPLDMYTGLACLFALPVEEANFLLKNLFNKNRNRVKIHKAITELGCEFDLLRDNLASQYKTFRILHQWVPRLSKYGIASKDVLDEKTVWSNLLNKVIDNYVKTEDDITDFLTLLKDVCTDFGLNPQCHLQYCLGAVLKTWNPKYTVTATEGKKEIEINKDQETLFERRCKALAHNIEDKNGLHEYLSKIKTQINFYLYEIFLMILGLIGEEKVTEFNFLYFLMQYTRTGKPGDPEIRNWERLTFEGCELPSISDYRLPFVTISKELWSIFEFEFNLKTYNRWLYIAKTLSLNENNICVLAITRSVDELLKCHQPSKGAWDVSQRIEVIFKEIRKCIDCMSGPEAYETGTAVLYYVMNKLPKGADKLLIARECHYRAQSWIKKSKVEDEKQKEKISLKISEIEKGYKQLTAEEILHTHGLGEKRYLDYIKRSVIDEQLIMNLIMKLYDHESVPLRYTIDLTSKPDIDGAVDALAKFFRINVLQLRIKLLLTVIQSNRDEGQTEMITKNITEIIKRCNGPETETDLSEIDLYKACYAIKSEIRSNDFQIVHMLIGMGFNNDDLYSFGERYRAMRILQLSIDNQTLVVLSRRDTNEFNNRMKSLMFLNELDELGFQFSAEEFKNLSKPEIIRLLFKRCFNTSKSQKAVDLCFGLYIEFKIFDISISKCILDQMRKFSMISTMKKILPAIANNCMIIYLEEFIACWQLLVDETFQKLSSQPSQRQTTDCIETLKILQACPVIHDLKFDDSLNSCFQSKQPWLSAALVPFLNDAKKSETLKIISENFNRESIAKELEILTKRGVISASVARENYFL